MAVITGPFVMRNASVKFASTDFASTCTKARLVPDVPIQTVRTLTPDGVVQDVDSAVWSFEVSGLTDWETGGLAAYLNTNSGTTVAVTLAPRVNVGNLKAVFNVIIIPAPFGGEQGEFGNFDLTMPVVGTPTFSAQS